MVIINVLDEGLVLKTFFNIECIAEICSKYLPTAKAGKISFYKKWSL